MCQDMGNRCRETSETASALEAAARRDVGGCHLPVWSSLRSSSRVVARSRLLATTHVSKGWVSKLVARWRLEGDAAFEPRSRRPHSSPRATPSATARVDRRPLRRAGRARVGCRGAHHLLAPRPASPAERVAGDGVPDPASGRADEGGAEETSQSSYIRFEADQPNECWQADFTHWRLADGSDVEILCWIDDHSRHGDLGHRPPPGHRRHRRRRVHERRGSTR